ncbi:hypothetical protein BRADO4747 [Bradyrhizobium sp. ORS 278]|nr:hypothetical protein BRADO4747 [Bradyrhizobium sp. ORS 278]
MNTVVVEASQIEVNALVINEIAKNLAQPIDFQKIIGVPDELHSSNSRVSPCELSSLRRNSEAGREFLPAKTDHWWAARDLRRCHDTGACL